MKKNKGFLKGKKMVWQIILFLLLIFLIGVPLVNILTFLISKKITGQDIALIAHRGGAALAPENTLPAIDTGIKYHSDYIEIDIRQTADNQLVVLHDSKIDRTSNGHGDIGKLTYAQLQQFNFAHSFTGFDKTTKIPLLKDVLDKIKNSESKLIIEIKNPKLYPGIANKLVQLIKETNTIGDVLVFSFDADVVFEIKKELPEVKTGIFCLGLEKNNYSSKVDFICPNWISTLYFPNLINSIHKGGAKSFVWTMNNSFWMRYVISKNVDGIITDNPSLLIFKKKI